MISAYLYQFQEYVISFIFALRTKLASYIIRFDFFDRCFLNVEGWQRDLKYAFLGESRAAISCRYIVSALRGINSGAIWKPPSEQKARPWSDRDSEHPQWKVV